MRVGARVRCPGGFVFSLLYLSLYLYLHLRVGACVRCPGGFVFSLLYLWLYLWLYLSLYLHLRVGACVRCPGGQELSDWPILAPPPSCAPQPATVTESRTKTTTNTTQCRNYRGDNNTNFSSKIINKSEMQTCLHWSNFSDEVASQRLTQCVISIFCQNWETFS